MGHDDTARIDLDDESAMKARLVEELESVLGTEVRVQTYYANQRLQVTVEPVGLTAELESRFPNCNIVPYSDIKFTVTES